VILDTSALVAIFFEEPEAESFSRLILDSEICRMSVVSHLEVSMVLERQAKAADARQLDVFLRSAGIVVEPVTLQQGRLARQAFYDFGRGRHRAKLNFGDCFSYALAKDLGEPLLFKGNDFSLTDIRVAIS
jgi:ribonuclease VapC